jgi:hypothetical protein
MKMRINSKEPANDPTSIPSPPFRSTTDNSHLCAALARLILDMYYAQNRGSTLVTPRYLGCRRSPHTRLRGINWGWIAIEGEFRLNSCCSCVFAWSFNVIFEEFLWMKEYGRISRRELIRLSCCVVLFELRLGLLEVLSIWVRLIFIRCRLEGV